PVLRDIFSRPLLEQTDDKRIHKVNIDIVGNLLTFRGPCSTPSLDIIGEIVDASVQNGNRLGLSSKRFKVLPSITNFSLLIAISKEYHLLPVPISTWVIR